MNVEMSFDDFRFTGRLALINAAAKSLNRVLDQQAHPIDRVGHIERDSRKPQTWEGDGA